MLEETDGVPMVHSPRRLELLPRGPVAQADVSVSSEGPEPSAAPGQQGHQAWRWWGVITEQTQPRLPPSDKQLWGPGFYVVNKIALP
jgi:hypothetical protein